MFKPLDLLRTIWGKGTDLDGNARAVLTCLVLHRNNDSGRCDPSVATIAAETALSERTVRRTLGQLDGGVLIRDRRDGRPSSYRINLEAQTPATVTPLPPRHPRHVDRGGVTGSQGTPATLAPELISNCEGTAKDVARDVLWPTYVELLGSERMKLTATRRKVLAALAREQLGDEPREAFARICRAVRASDFHMSKPEYHQPESLFRNEEKRETWAEKGRALTSAGGTAYPLMLSVAELRRLDEGGPLLDTDPREATLAEFTEAVHSFCHETGAEWNHARSVEDWAADVAKTHPGLDLARCARKAADWWNSEHKTPPKDPVALLHIWIAKAEPTGASVERAAA